MNAVQKSDFDVIVVGSGSAGLCAAVSAADQGAKVLLLEKSPKAIRGGNGRYTRGGMLIAHDGIDDPEIRAIIKDLKESEIESLQLKTRILGCTVDEYYSLLMRASKGLADPVLCERFVKEAKPAISWLRQIGVPLHVPLFDALRAGHRPVVPGVAGVVGTKGGGEALIEHLFKLSEQKGVDIRYETKAVKLLMDNTGKVTGVKIKSKAGFQDVSSKTVVLCAGSWECNPEMRTKYLGREWDVVKLRGSKYNTGDALNMAFEIGAAPAGSWSSCHCTLIDVKAPDGGGGADTARDTIMWGIVVNQDGKRFADEGEDYDPYFYAKMGGLTLQQPRGLVYEIFDAKVTSLLAVVYKQSVPIEANSIEELAPKLDIDTASLVKTVKDFNAAAQGNKANPGLRDGKQTKGILPVKTNWSQPLDTPPFRAYPVTAGISFTYGGIKTDKDTRVMDTEGNVIPGLYAAGAVVGGFYYYNYAPATGITKHVTFGRIAGTNAGKFARQGS